MKGFLLSSFALLLLAGAGLAQEKAPASAARSSAAFAEVLLRKTELLADAESLSADYTDTNPKLIDLRYEGAALDRYLSRLDTTPAPQSGKLTPALGKLMVRRASLDVELARMGRTLNIDHPDYKRIKKKLEIYDAAIKEILP
jgi:hypothetical protein